MFWLVVQFALLARRFATTGQLEPQRVPDTLSYEIMAGVSSLRDALSGVRTYGYPLFLKLFGPLPDDYALVPIIHMALFFLAVTLFYAAVREFSGSSWMALAIASPLLYTCGLVYIKRIGTDAPAMALALTAVSLLLLVAKRPGSALSWIGLGLAVFLACQVRPSSLFLLLLIPLAGVVVGACARGSALRALPFASALAAVTVGPFLLFCLLRLFVVGEFGLVSFTGYNAIGIAASMLDAEVLRELPEENQLLAWAILRERKRRNMKPFTFHSAPRPFFELYSRNIFYIAEPLGTAMANGVRDPDELLRVPLRKQRENPKTLPPLYGERVQTMNRMFSSLSSQVFRVRPALYLKWVRDSFTGGLARIVACPSHVLLTGLLLLAYPLALLRQRGATPAASSPAILSTTTIAVGVIAVAFVVFQLLLTAVVNRPDDRLVGPAFLLVPSFLGALLFDLGRLIGASGSASTPGRGRSAR